MEKIKFQAAAEIESEKTPQKHKGHISTLTTKQKKKKVLRNDGNESKQCSFPQFKSPKSMKLLMEKHRENER